MKQMGVYRREDYKKESRGGVHFSSRVLCRIKKFEKEEYHVHIERL